MSVSVARALGTTVIAAAVGVGVGAMLVGRVLRAERQAMGPLILMPQPGERAAIVVFGATTLPTGPCRELVARLEHARSLAEQGRASTIVVSGGTVVDDEGRILDESADMAAWLIDQGVPAESVMLGLPGANTRQTIATMARITRETGMHPWIAVSSPFHARRIRDEARRVGVDVVVSGPGDGPETLDREVYRLRVIAEVLGTVYYALPPKVASLVPISVRGWRHTIPHRLVRMDE